LGNKFALVGKFFKPVGWLRRSSMLRLSLLLSVIFAIGMAAAIFIALTLGQSAIERRVDTTMQAFANATVLENARTQNPDIVVRARNDLQDLPRAFERAAAKGGGTADLDDDFRRSDVWRVLVTTDSSGTPIVLAFPIEDREEAQELLAGVLWTTATLVILLTLAIGFGAGLLAQRRVAVINQTLDRLGKGELGARTGHRRSKDDLDDVARQVDHTATELERLVAQTRNLSASLAHDLRTPLARLQARLEDLPEGIERAAALDEANRLSGVFDTIMRVARIEAAQGQDGFASVDLAELAAELAEVFGPVVEDAGKSLQLDMQNPATVAADRQMLVQAVANLIQNALVHGGADITLMAHGRRLGVADNGAGVDPAQFAEIVKPMVRLDAARASDGTGLGLALVRAVADRHDASLDLASVDPHGLQVTLHFAKL